MSNTQNFGAGFVGGVAGAIASQPGGIRRLAGIIGLILTVAVTASLAAFMPLERRGVSATATTLVVIGVLWLPWCAAKALYPWHKFRWHIGITVELIQELHFGAIALLVTFVTSGIVAVIASGTEPRWVFAVAILLNTTTGLGWGFLTAAIARDLA